MYGLPNCKRFEVQQSDSPRKMYPTSKWRMLFRLLMMIRVCQCCKSFGHEGPIFTTRFSRTATQSGDPASLLG